MGKASYRLSFRIDRQAGKTLTAQVADGLREAILTRRFKPGNTLPTKLEMAAELGVNDITIRRALAQLKREGLIAPRPRRGILVCDPTRFSWRGHVLFASWSGPDMYYHTVMAAEITRRLHAQRFLVTDMHLDGAAHANEYPEMRGVLETRSVDLVLVEGGGWIEFQGQGPTVWEVLKRFRLPVVYVDAVHPTAEVSVRPDIGLSTADAYEALAAHCLECGIRSALLAAKDAPRFSAHHPAQALALQMEAQGISCDWLEVTPVAGLRSPESVERGGLRAMQTWLALARPLPDFIYFDDDFIARGALLALTRHGIRIPEDVQVASWANKGLGPVYDKPLTRIEMDPVAHGVTVAEYVLRVLSEGVRPSPLALTPDFIAGATTRRLGQSENRRRALCPAAHKVECSEILSRANPRTTGAGGLT